jgi:hypothetical protein
MCFLLADKDRRLEMNVNDNKQLVVTRLEEEMFDVAEQDICNRVESTTFNIPHVTQDIPILCEDPGEVYRRPF